MSISRARSGLNTQSTTPQLLCTSLAIVTSHYTGAGYADNSWVHPLIQMAAPKLSFRATFIAFIVALSLLVLLAAPVSARNCKCKYGVISAFDGAQCWYDGPGEGEYVTLPYNTNYKIYCQRTGPHVSGNNWWNLLPYNGGYCYVNDYYMKTGCATRCYNLPICHED